MKTILSHANLIDCVEPQLRPDAAVLIEDGRIRAILPSGEADSARGDAQVIDLKGGYLMPGLWDVHIHPDYLSLDEMPLADQVTLFGHRLAVALTESGIVGLRCAGAHHFMGRGMEAGLRLRTACRPSAVRQRLFPHHDRRTLSDLGPCTGGRRPLRLGESHP
jgi:imidazolonepropionase-like amidohydrolase